jgi:hypothetical protein
VCGGVSSDEGGGGGMRRGRGVDGTWGGGGVRCGRRVDGACSGVRGNEGGGGGVRSGVLSNEGGGIRCGSMCGVEEVVGKGVLKKSAPVADAQGRCTVARGQMACGRAKRKVLSAPRASRTSWRRAVAYHPEDAEGVSKEYAAECDVHAADQQG